LLQVLADQMISGSWNNLAVETQGAGHTAGAGFWRDVQSWKDFELAELNFRGSSKFLQAARQ
jgi:hypothetical protein